MKTRHVWGAALVYLVVALFATWPLARGLAADVASDLGDPVLNMWILSWDCEQLLAILGGDLARIGSFFGANIFYPSPLTLAYSEHLFPQALQVLPVYAVTRNPILCYNLLLLSTFVLSGVGAYLLIRELSGNAQAAFLGGLLFAFALYRVPQASHVQVLSSQWMPFTLYGFTRYLNTGRRRALAGGTAALVAQALSCGYYLLFFSPFAAAFVLWELIRRGLIRNVRVWRDFTVAAAAACLVLAPFLVPYARVHDQLQMAREVDEVVNFSADVYSYFTAFPNQQLWGGVLEMFPRDEAQLFPGALPIALGLMAFATWGVSAWRAGKEASEDLRGRSGPGLARFALVLGALAAVATALFVLAVFQRRIVLDVGVFTLRVSSLGRVLVLISILLAALLAVSPRARVMARASITPLGFFCVAMVAAWWLSLGPAPRAFGRPLELPAPYAFLYGSVPGFDGVRVPARYAMVLVLMLSSAGALAVTRWLDGRRGWVVVAALSGLFLIEAPARVFPLNAVGVGKGYVAPEPRLFPPADAPAIYRHVRALPQDAILLELPLGDPTWDVFATYYSTAHWKRLVNGYSGFFPPSYPFLSLGLQDPDRDPALSRQVLLSSHATHVIVHERAYRPQEAGQVVRWLEGSRAVRLAREGSDVLFALPQP